MNGGFGNQGASSGKSKGKKKKAKRLSLAFFYFFLVFGIEPFQRVTAEKSRKNSPASDSRSGLWVSRLQTATTFRLRAEEAPDWIPLIGICVATISDFVKGNRDGALRRHLKRTSAQAFTKFVMEFGLPLPLVIR
jgi:hypothetical protein